MYIVYIQYKQYNGVVLLDIIISNSIDKPIYVQIKDQLKTMIISGALKEGDALPSMRLLAKELRISVITTKRAYDELEREGFIYTVPAKGCFVSPKNTELLREENLKTIEMYIDEIAKLAMSCNLGVEDIIEMFKFSMEEK